MTTVKKILGIALFLVAFYAFALPARAAPTGQEWFVWGYNQDICVPLRDLPAVALPRQPRRFDRGGPYATPEQYIAAVQALALHALNTHLDAVRHLSHYPYPSSPNELLSYFLHQPGLGIGTTVTLFNSYAFCIYFVNSVNDFQQRFQ